MVMFLQVSVCAGGGACVVARGRCAWLWGVAGMCGCGGWVGGCRGAAWVEVVGHAWLQGGVCGCRGHVWWWEEVQACVVAGWRAWDTTRYGQWAGGTHPTGVHSCFNVMSMATLRANSHQIKVEAKAKKIKDKMTTIQEICRFRLPF